MTDQTTARLQDQLKATKRLIKISEARQRLLPFMQLMMPDPTDPDDADKSRYVVTPQATLLCEIIEKMQAGKLRRVCVSIAPQHGKSEVLSRAAPAWLQGRNPYRHFILASYNQTLADGFGHDVRANIQSSAYRQIFPDFRLRSGGESVSQLITEQGGKLAFIGIGASGSGRPADTVIVDDCYKDRDDAYSISTRERVWNWFMSVALARAHNATSILVVSTRYHEEDLIGRLADPTHPERNGLYAGIKGWNYFNLPAVVKDPELAKALGLTLESPSDLDVIEQFGKEPMSALWPARHSLPLLAEKRAADRGTFEAMYNGRPSPEEGSYFQAADLIEYRREELPKNLRIYSASDHAVSKKQSSDLTCLGAVGIDESDTIWVLPTLVWKRMETLQTVEELIAMFQAHKPMMHWAENELIFKSAGPFLKKRMQAEHVYTPIDPITPSADIETRARSIQGLIGLHMVRFPGFAPWWPAARQQLLNFPAAAKDDLVAWLALIGLGVQKTLRPSRMKVETKEPPSGSMAWILKRSAERNRKEARKKAVAGW